MRMPDIRLPEGGVGFHADDNAGGGVARALASTVADVLASRLEQAPRASLVVSGGSTPLPFFKALSDADLDWSRVDVVLADERWVPEGDPASNTTLVRNNLLVGRAAKARYLALKQPGGEIPDQGLEAVRQALSVLVLPVDVVILGMGNDGHTASLFPDAPELSEAMDKFNTGLVAAMTPESQPQPRVTLTRAVLAQARFTALHLKGGEDKLDTLRRACSALDDVFAMPVRAFLKPGLEVFWSP